MIFYLDKHVEWNKRSGSELEQQIRSEMEKIEAEYFSDKSLGYVKVIYPKGEPDPDHRVFGILKKYPVSLKSADGAWRYSKSRPRVEKSGQLTYDDHHLMVTHKTVLTKKDIELVWFLKYKSPAVRSKKIYLENLEEEAKEEVLQLSDDADIRYMLFGNGSPIAKDSKLLSDVASIFGVKDVDKIGLNQIKVALFEKLVEGNKRKDRFVNFAKFEELTEGTQKRKAAFLTRGAIADGIVGYRDRAWWLKEGREFVEKLLDIRPVDVEYRAELLIEEVIKNANIRSRLFSAIGEDETMTLEDLRLLDRPVLMRLAGDKGIGDKMSNTIKKEEIIELLCDKMKIEYKPKSA